jgi:hypothetical protein
MSWISNQVRSPPTTRLMEEISLDPVENNEIITRLQDGALVYVTVGDDPIEQYL